MAKSGEKKQKTLSEEVKLDVSELSETEIAQLREKIRKVVAGETKSLAPQRGAHVASHSSHGDNDGWI